MENNPNEVVDRVTAVNEKLLADHKISWLTARQSLSIILNDLTELSPSHPAVGRLREFIARHDARSSDGKEQS